MIRRVAVLGALLALVSLSAAASFAASVNTTLTLTPASELTVEVVVNEAVGDSFTSALTGLVNTTIDWDTSGGGPEATGLAINTADIAVADGSLSIDLGGFPGNTLELGFDGVHMTLFGFPGDPLGGGTFDIGGTLDVDDNLIDGTAIGFDAGLAPYAIPFFSIVGSFDFGAEPAGAPFPIPTVATVTGTPTGTPSQALATLTIPIDLTIRLLDQADGDPLTVDMNLTGLIEASGLTVVPEPGAISLLLMGLMGLAPLRRRRERN